ALVGALLWDSGRVRDVRDWLRPGDLKHWKARSIYQTLTGLHRDGRSVPVTELPAVITARTYHDSRHGAITAVDLHTYLRATPATPPASTQFPDQLVRSNHVVYARRVLEAAARSMVAVAGSRIQEAAEHSREYPDLGAGALSAALAHTQQRLQVLGERLRHAQGSPGSLITAALGGPVPDTLPADAPEPATAGIQPGPPAPPLTTRAVIEAEREVLTACLTDPTTRAALLGWLTPEDFCRPEHAATWAAYSALTKAGTPIDYVTLAWECERHHHDHDSPGLPADQLATMARHTPGLPGPAVRTVAHASLLRHTEAAREHVAAIADDRAADALTVVSAAEKAYREVGEHARRLSGTTAVSRASAALNPTTPHEPPTRWPHPPPARPPDKPPQPDHSRGR
ncbi:MAG: DnaB-like helicase N-terminal domain-containing protein, partial [Candidatus Dormibacteria bacterium]